MIKNDLFIQDTIIIPEHELEITTSRSGGPGGQHVNKTESRITIRWNVKNTNALNEVQKLRVLENLASQLTADGDLIVHNSASRSQQQNKEMALKNVADKVRKALHVPKKRMKTRVSKATKEKRLESKSHRGVIKRMRSKKIQYD